MIGIILNVTVITLLTITIVYVARVNAKLSLLKSQKHDFAAAIKTFNDTTEAAIVAVEELHIKGEEVCKMLDERIKRAQLMGDEIEFITSRAKKHLIGLKALESKTSTPVVAEPIRHHVGHSLAEAQLLKALRDREYKESLVS